MRIWRTFDDFYRSASHPSVVVDKDFALTPVIVKKLGLDSILESSNSLVALLIITLVPFFLPLRRCVYDDNDRYS